MDRITEAELQEIESSWDKTERRRIGANGLTTFDSSVDVLIDEVRRLRALIDAAWLPLRTQTDTKVEGSALGALAAEADAIREEQGRG